MAVDKRINYRGGGAYQGGSGAPGSAEAGKTVGSVGGPSYDSGPSISGRDTGGNQPSYERSRNQFIDKFNRDRTAALGRKYKPIGLDRFGSSNQLGAKGGLGNLFKTLFGFATGIPIGLFNKGKSGITSINNALGDFREKFTGYRTQQEYDDARQQRIDLNRINTIQNTLDTKYADGDYSMTDLDERLAALQQGLGIVPNTAAQNAQQFLDFSNQPELSFEDIKKLAQPNINSSGLNTLPIGIAPNNYNIQYIEPLSPNLDDPVQNQVGNIDGLMAFAPNSKRDRALKNLYSGYENLGIKDPQMIDLMQQDLLENKEKGTPLSLPQSAYTLVG
jgi:hypothetical protein